MIFGNGRYSHSRACVSILTLAVYLATMLPPRRAEADTGPFPGIAQGTGGAGSLDGPSPQAGSTESLATVDLSTGAATSSYPFQLPTARGLAQPSLGLSYSSATGIGFAGMGWTLDVPTIERRGASGGMPQYDPDFLGTVGYTSTPDPTADKYVFNGQPLVPICIVGGPCGDKYSEQFPSSLTHWAYFRTEIDNGMRFFLSPDTNTWQVQTKTGVTMTFGVPGDTLVGSALPVEIEHDALATGEKPGAVGTQYRWNLSRQTDPMGNVVAYVWSRPEFNQAGGVDPVANQGREYLTDIYDTLSPAFTGTGGAEASFAHHTHLNWTLPNNGMNPLLALSPSWRTPQSLSLANVDVTSSPLSGGARQILRRYWLGYQTLGDQYGQSESNTQQYLNSIQLEGACGNQAENKTDFLLPATTGCPKQPAMTMTYQAPALSLAAGGPNSEINPAALLVDTNGDSIPEEITGGNQPTSLSGQKATSTDLFPPTNQIGRVALGDWNSGGVPEWLWVNIDPWILGGSPGSSSADLYELYSASGSGTVNFQGLKGPTGNGATALPASLFEAPTSSLQPFVPDLNSKRAMDIDGDGYTDMALMPLDETNPNTDVFSAFTQRDVTGAITPFGRHSPAYCMNPMMFGWSQVCNANGCTQEYRHAVHPVVADADGDGLADVIVMENVVPNAPPGQPAVNGQVTAHVYKNRGDGRFGLPDPSAPSCAQGAWVPYDIPISTGGGIDDYSFGSLPSTSMHDVDGDGLADFVWVDPNGLWVTLTRFIPVAVLTFPDGGSTGGGWALGGSITLHATTQQLGCSSTGYTYNPTSQTVLFGDLAGDGVDSIYAYVCDQVSIFHLTDPSAGTTGPRPGLLSTISNGQGVTTTISYDTIHHVAGSTPIPVAGQVVTEVKTTNGLTGPYYASSLDTTYSYDSPVYDARDRQFLGFKNVTQKQLGGSSSSPGVDTTTRLATGTCPNVSATNPCAYTKDYGWRIQRGLVAAVETSTDGGGPQLSTTVNTYDYSVAYTGSDGRVVRRVTLGQTDEYLWDSTAQTAAASASITVLQSTPGIAGPYGFSTSSIVLPATNYGHKQHQYSVDAKGNPSWHLDLGLINSRAAAVPAQAADIPIVSQTIWSLPTSDPTGWNWKPTYSSTSYADSSGNPLGQTRALTLGYWPTTGLLNTISSVLTGTQKLSLASNVSAPPDQSVEGATITLTTLSYNQWGDLTQIARPGGQCTGIDYDPAFQQLPADSYQYTGPNCGGTPLQTTFRYDRGFEQVTATVSPSGALSMSSLDAFGRVTATYQNDPSALQTPSASATTIVDYSRFDTAGPVRLVKTQTLVGNNAYRTDYGYYDGFGRHLLSVGQTEVAAQWTVSGLSQLDAATGRAVVTCSPFFVNNLADGSTFNVQAAATCPAKSMVYDGFGRVTKVTDEAGRVTQITYSPATLSQKVQNAKQLASGASTVVVSDGHGRVVQRVDNLKTPADIIATTYSYLATGELQAIVKTHTAGTDSYSRSMSYDTLGRRVSTYEPNGSETTVFTRPTFHETINEWRYAYNDAGQLVGTSDARNCGEILQYDPLGRLLGEDYAPCTSQQPTYTPANWSTGAGLETRFVYDTPEVTGQLAILYKGKLAASYDRASHTQVAVVDARGRTKAVNRQVAAPIGSTSQYTPHYFTRSLAYDDANHIIGATTGAEVGELAAEAWVLTNYNVRGGVDQVTTSFGNGQLLNSRTFGPSGEALTSVFGDASNVTQDRTYNPDGTLARLHTHRNAGPWVAATATYTPPAARNTAAIGELQDLNFTNYDGALNPGTISDAATGGWPTGSLPVTRNLKYDDLNRLTSATIGYGSGGTATDAYNKPYQPEIAKGDDSFPAAVAPPTTPTTKYIRPTSQTFAYDFLGNITSSGDDQNISPDRSFGTATYPKLGGSFAPSDGNLLTTATQNGTTISAYYDNAGNTTEVTVTHPTPCAGPCVTEYQYNWDELGRLLSAERFEGTTLSSATPKVTFQYLYTAQGERVLKQETNQALAGGGTVVSYDVNVFPTLRLQTGGALDQNGDYTRSTSTETVFLQDGAGQVYGRAIYAAGSVPSATGDAVHVYLELGNHLGSTAFVIDHDSGELVEATSDLVYGMIDSDSRDLQAASPKRWNYFRADYRYTGHEDEAEVGLSYMGQRYYMPMLARFASPDPVSIHSARSDLNPYAYVHGSPLAKVDPFGLCEDPSDRTCGMPNDGGGILGNLLNPVGQVVNWIGSYETHPSGHGGGWGIPWTPKIAGIPLTRTPMVYTAPRVVEMTDLQWTTGNYIGVAALMLVGAFAVGSVAATAAIVIGGMGGTGAAVYVAFANAAPVVGDIGLSISQGGILTTTAVGGAVLVAEAGVPELKLAAEGAGLTGTALARQLGTEGELAANILKNTERIPSLTGTAAYRIPDILNHEAGIIGEVKNVATLPYTNQLRDFAAYAGQQGYQFQLFVRPTTILSGPLQMEIENGAIMLQFLP
jgi:RHS repeat-associated protein